MSPCQGEWIDSSFGSPFTGKRRAHRDEGGIDIGGGG